MGTTRDRESPPRTPISGVDMGKVTGIGGKAFPPFFLGWVVVRFLLWNLHFVLGQSPASEGWPGLSHFKALSVPIVRFRLSSLNTGFIRDMGV